LLPVEGGARRGGEGVGLTADDEEGGEGEGGHLARWR
jgi:hypothetical protein